MSTTNFIIKCWFTILQLGMGLNKIWKFKANNSSSTYMLSRQFIARFRVDLLNICYISILKNLRGILAPIISWLKKFHTQNFRTDIYCWIKIAERKKKFKVVNFSLTICRFRSWLSKASTLENFALMKKFWILILPT